MHYPFSEFLRILGKGPKSRRPLTTEEAEAAIKMLLNGEVTDRQLGAFLLLMRSNGETQQELIGFLTGLRDFYPLNKAHSAVDLDISAYAGKWRYPPYFLLSAKLLAQNGYKILVHGDSGQFDDRQYAEAFAKQLDFYMAQSIEDAEKNIHSGQVVYLPLQSFAPELQSILHLKDELGVRTIFNTLVKVLNPLNATSSMQGIFHKGVENLHHAAAQLNGTQTNLVFKGEGGEPEIRPDALNKLYFSHHGQSELHTEDFSAICERHSRPEFWDQTDLQSLWLEGDDNYGKQAVIATTAVALMVMEKTAKQQALDKAEAMWEQRFNHA